MPDDALQTAQNLKQSGQIREAAALYQDMLRADPRNFEALKALGTICIEGNQGEQAHYLIDQALTLNPADTDCLCLRGIALMQMQRRPEAIVDFGRALALKPDFAEALVNRGTALQEMQRFDEALKDFGAALSLNPYNAVGWNNLGTTYVAMQRFDEAVASYDKALGIDAAFGQAQENRRKAMNEAANRNAGAALAQRLCARGVEHMRQKLYAEALESFDEAILAQPDSADAYSNRGSALMGMGRVEGAISAFERALGLDPRHAVGWNNRGNALALLRRFEEAVQSYDRALALTPEFPQAVDNRESALFELKRGTRCPPGFMTRLFDDFASHYDATMLDTLHYRAHLHLRDLAARVAAAMGPKRILDLGSGTGLVGEAFKEMAAGGRLDGIDLSQRMIEAARARGIYDDLILGDIETELAGPGALYDLILAADTMIYLGGLDPVFAGVAGRLEPGGFYLFAVESKPGEGWEQTPMNRFRHSETYVREAAAKAGLEVIEIGACTLRTEAGGPVGGFAVALKKPIPV